MARKIFNRRLHYEANTGFGATANSQGNRLISKDGSFNVRRVGIPLVTRANFYHDLINMQWYKFILIVLASYTVINLIFASLFLYIGLDELQGTQGVTLEDRFWEAFFFSSQTLTTVGYGRTNPIGFHANVIAAIECLIGLMMFAVITGLLYGRFSKPRAKLIYSNNALIGPYKEGLNALMFRIANSRRNQLIECEAQVMMSFIEPETNLRRFVFLDLEFKQITSLALSWTIVHPINTESPLNGLSQAELEAMDAEFILIFKAFDDTYSQTVHTRHSYPSYELIWGAKFDMMYRSSDDRSKTVLELNKINHFYRVDLNDRIQQAAESNS